MCCLWVDFLQASSLWVPLRKSYLPDTCYAPATTCIPEQLSIKQQLFKERKMTVCSPTVLQNPLMLTQSLGIDTLAVHIPFSEDLHCVARR